MRELIFLGAVDLVLLILIIAFIINGNLKKRRKRFIYTFFPLLDKKSSITIDNQSVENSQIQIKKPVSNETINDNAGIKGGIILNIIFIILIIFAVMINYTEITVTLILTSVITLVFFNWITYIGYIGIDNITNFLAGLKQNIWILLYISPFAIIAVDSKLISSSQSLLKVIYNLEVLVLLVICILSLWKLMINIMIDKESIFMRIDTATRNSNTDCFFAIISVIIIQLMNFIALVYSLNNRFPELLNKGEDAFVTGFSDIVYYVVMTYTTVGYGDIAPNLLLAKIVACIISITGFLTSLCLIGEVIKGFDNGNN